MKTCPFCAEQIPDEAKVCKFCSSTVVRKCPLCAEEILATARSCRFCRSEIPAEGAPAARPAARPLPDAPLGETRSLPVLVLLTLLTCGIWGAVLCYKMGEEINAHGRTRRVSPGVDLLLVFCTCGLWLLYVMYRYPRALHEALVEEGLAPTDLAVPCLLLTLLGGWPGAIAGIALLQNELNKHWEAHGAPPA